MGVSQDKEILRPDGALGATQDRAPVRVITYRKEQLTRFYVSNRARKLI